MKNIITIVLVLFIILSFSTTVLSFTNQIPDYFNKTEQGWVSAKNYNYNQIEIVHSQSFQSVIDQREIVKKLKKIYGKPIKDCIVWYNDRHKHNFNLYSRAVAFGQMEIITEWNSFKVKLHGGDNNIILEIIKK